MLEYVRNLSIQKCDKKSVEQSSILVCTLCCIRRLYHLTKGTYIIPLGSFIWPYTIKCAASFYGGHPELYPEDLAYNIV